MIQEVIVLHINEKLSGGRVRVLSPCHSDGATRILKAVVGLVFYGRLRLFLFHVRSKSSSLNHEIINDAVKNGAVIESVRHVGQEVLDRLGRMLCVELQSDRANGGGHQDGC